MVTKKSLNTLKKTLGLTGAILVASAISPNTASAQGKLVDNKDKTEVTVTPNNYIVVDTATVEGILTAKDEKEAKKMLSSYSKEYGIAKEMLPKYFEKVLAEFSGQEYLYFETIKHDMKPHKHTVDLMGEKTTYKTPGPKTEKFDRFYVVVGNNHSQEESDIDYIHAIVNAKDVFAKSGLNLLNPLPSQKKMFSDEGLLNMAQNRIYGDQYGVDMQVNKDGRLDGVSTILQFNDGKSEEIAHLTYDKGKFIGGEVRGQPILKIDGNNQLAMQKALGDLRQNQ